MGTQRFDPAGLATVSTQLVSGARWTSLRDSAMCRPWVIRALKESFTPVPFLVSRVRAALPADAHKNTFGVHLRDRDGVARSEEKEEDGEATMVQPGRRMETGSACTIDNTHAAIADAVLSAARKNTAVHTVYVAGSSGTMLARFRAYFEANASSLPAVGGRPRAIRLMTIADIMPNLSHAHVRADTNGMHDALADLWALGATATLFRARSSTFGMLAAILNNELKRSVIVESSSCGDLSDGSDLASAQHSFCGNHGAAGDAEVDWQKSYSVTRRLMTDGTNTTFSTTFRKRYGKLDDDWRPPSPEAAQVLLLAFLAADSSIGGLCAVEANRSLSCAEGDESACRSTSGALRQAGIWAVSDATLPNYFTVADADERSAYREAVVAVLNSQKSGSGSLRTVMKLMCANASLAQARTRGYKPGHCTTHDARECSIVNADRLLTFSADCGPGFSGCTGCYAVPLSTPALRPPPMVVLHLLREPVARLVSAFEWCTRMINGIGRPGDTMCASYYLHFAPFKNFSGRLDPSASSNRTALLSHLVRFAVQHWRSYETTRLLDRASLAPQCEVRPGSSTAVDMGSLMARTLESRFAAVGLLENFSTSLVLFQLASGLSFAAHAETHVHNSSAPEVLSESALNRTATLKQDALADSRIMDAVRDDKVVYAAAQQLFERQLQSARELGHRV